jgi:hypothetical protein
MLRQSLAWFLPLSASWLTYPRRKTLLLPVVAWVVATSIIDPKISHQSKEAVIDCLFFYVIFLVLGALVNLNAR